MPPGGSTIDDALGCVVAAPVVATEPVPPFVNSSRDGFALRSVDSRSAGPDRPLSLRVVTTIMAGSAFTGTIGPGQAARIMTGAPLPAGADAVCMLEDCSEGDEPGTVVIDHPLVQGEAVRAVGEDVGVGDLVTGTGTVLTPGHLGRVGQPGSRGRAGPPPAEDRRAVHR